MAKEKKTIAPILRFPEFIGHALRETLLGDVTAESTTRNGQTLPTTSVMGVTKAAGIVPMEERIIASDIARYKIVQKDWFAYNPMRLNIGSIARWQGDASILVSPDYVVFRCLDDPNWGIDPVYLDHFRASRAWEAFVTQGGDGGVRVRIYYEDIARVRLALPSPAEQRKIAGCLTSLDQWIAVEGRKLEALRTHKTGLMQQLFPRAGEPRPRLRFPEFHDGPGWVTAPFHKLYTFAPTNTLSRAELSDGDGTVKNIHYGDIHTKFAATFRIQQERVPYVAPEAPLGTIKPEAFCREGDMIFADSSEDLLDVGKSMEIVELNGEQVVSGSHTILAHRLNDSLVVGFGAYMFKSRSVRAQIEKQAQGIKVMAISPNRLAGIDLHYPSSQGEQQRIASCLSSLDALIHAQAQKLDSLRVHKKGLMQQLFRSPEGVVGHAP